MKNAIDWASRPPGDNSFEGKPAAIMSASIGTFGGARAQHQLRQVLVTLNMHPINRPEVMVPLAGEKFDEKGRLIDEKTRAKIQDLLESLVALTRKMKCLKEEL